MAISEACGLWIQQRLEEEIEERGDTKASVREIGRIVAAEIEKVFETKVNPRTIEKKAERMVATNVAPETTPCNDTENEGVQGGAEITPSDATLLVDAKIEDGKSKKSARKEVAKETGLNENSVKSAHQRAEKKKEKETPYFIPDLETEDFNKAFVAFYREVSGAKIDEWKYTSKETCLKRVESLRYQIENR